MFFLLLLLATASCTVNAMEIKYLSVPKELPEDSPEISKNARKATIETINLENINRRKMMEKIESTGESCKLATQNNSNSK